MTYELIKEVTSPKIIRTYINNSTGTEITVQEIYKDKEGKTWLGFTDLFNIPIIRVAMARNITDLFSLGLSLKDILTWCNEEKKLLKSNDPEKYEKLYSLILEKEKLASFTADPIRQHLALCTVYILGDDERIDYFNENIAMGKLDYWAGIPEAVAFFLHWHNEHIRRYSKTLENISKTVLKLSDNSRKVQPLKS